MRVVVLPMDEAACGSYRCTWPGAMAADQMGDDWQVEIYRPGTIQMGVDDHDRLAAVMGLDLDGIDLMVTQRLGTPRMLEFMRFMQSKGTAVVVDADDALWCIHRENAAYSSWNGGVYHWSWMDQCAKEADLVTVTTERLARRYGKHGRVEVLPNRVPAGVCDLHTPEQDEIVDIGWAGWVGTHPTDLHVVGDSVSRILAEHTSSRVTVVGDGQGILAAWGLRDLRERVEATGTADIDGYFANLTLLDLGLVPLADNVFNNCKSSLKVAEYAAVGVPAIATPTPANLALAKEGYPLFLAHSPDQWHIYLDNLIRNSDARLKMAEQALAAAQKHTMENHIGDWISAWTRAISRRRAVAR